MPFGGLLTVGLLGAGSSLFSGLFGSNAASTAASQQSSEAQAALDFEKQIWGQQQANQQPFLNAGTTSIQQIMADLASGKFGAGSLPNAPTFNGTFSAPTLAQAQNSPGYQFTAQQGSKGILEGAAAAGGAISGGTLKSLDAYNTGLANNTYNDVFNRSLATYNTGLDAYKANLGGYEANLQKQAQEFGQAFAPAQLGENAVQNLNQAGNSAALNVASLMGQIGNANAAGTIGSANALTQGISGGANGLSQAFLLSRLLNSPSGTGPGGFSLDTSPALTPG